MKNTLLQSLINDSFGHMFVVNKRGKIVFFPWGGKKQGYYLKSKMLMTKAKKFYSSSFLVCLILFSIASSRFYNFWGIIGSMFVSFGGWYLVYFLYTSKIVKSLPLAKASYNEIILEKLESEDEEESPQSAIQFPAHWNQPVSKRKKDVFGQIQHIWYRLSPGHIFLVCFFVGLFTALIWSTYRPEQWVDADYLVGFLVCLLLGYGGFVVTQTMGLAKEDWFMFQYKLSMILIMVAGWSFAAWFLYKFVVLMVVQR